ncbi:alpha-amylase/subtilisin inhibitor precursor [Oryza sativa Japonica Group]|uniref:Alpha-amylase/subtilisin inhibitor n=7 Tax=Oryza TaxID=4527 RepID=IAAS_ORYSJ|nr:alpha-amylase/subtilisin inhibitor precursor [Oryza sativa Japonica Group]P29421.2 RecName: Full=Alpha-amylase/subtilisin inhibitor; AltName: Full=RASI; Flags: Precursor [Oryza sativa Japonica Group]2QN4_A Chain A, Alpha-amylase/subtilisin inhibitor [Oryza sativa Japonica Group]2QN4_B Chain B, Alpha-amylase/subtilisin inhibitor [Oryza sativa Japonica Group]AGI56255.1 alpha amylase inhibitor [Oryza sativa Indica Group]CAH67899.1 OSIGBa0115K01-H0319F09.5 [Oryza sativa]AAN86549.1 alpha-amylas|eukprot:NP_001053363.1 Os04g0526600 [Oryza sativa Japonica Group]
MVSLRLPLILLSLLAISFSCSAAPPPVYDTEGHELSADGSYYVLPASPGHGGGLTMAPRVLPCPLLVAQETDERRKGFPVRFTPWGGAAAPEDRTIRVSTDVRIRFNAATICVQSTEWHVGDEPLTGARRVVTGPLIGPSPSGRENAFRVEKYGGGYKLVSCRDSCQDLGVSRDGARAWLGASQPPHVVVFKKARPSPPE